MKKKYTFIMFLLVFCFLCTVQVFASRAYELEKIPPVIYKDIRIIAENNSPDNIGVVQAFNVNTNKLIWSKKVYKVRRSPFVEEDTQLIFIKEMKIENDRLIVINENLKSYILDPNTGKSLNARTNSIIIIAIAILVIIIMYVVLKRRKKIVN